MSRGGRWACGYAGFTSPKAQLENLIARFNPEIAALAREVLAKMRARLPGAIELVYDNYNALAIGFATGERASDGVFSIVLYPRWVTLFFLEGAFLPDPHEVLEGKGKVVRHIVLGEARDLDSAPIQTLMKLALKQAEKPFDASTPGRVVIKAICAKQRPRRPLPKR